MPANLMLYQSTNHGVFFFWGGGGGAREAICPPHPPTQVLINDNFSGKYTCTLCSSGKLLEQNLRVVLWLNIKGCLWFM